MSKHNGRNANGTFTKGNQHAKGHGRPKRETELQYLEIAKGSISLESFQQICERAVQDAMGGDAQARTWITKLVFPEAISFTELHKRLAVQDEDIEVDIETRKQDLNFRSIVNGY